MGPKETDLRRMLAADGGLTAADEARLHPVARFRLSDYLRKGIAYRGGDGRPRLKVYRPDPVLVALQERDRAAAAERRAREDQDRARWREELEARATREREARAQLRRQLEEREALARATAAEQERQQEAQRRLYAGTERLSIEDRRIIVAERLAVLAELEGDHNGQTEGIEEQEAGTAGAADRRAG